jgi:hypothetical protein
VAEFTLEVPGRPVSINTLSQADHWARTNEVTLWREATAWAIKASGNLPKLQPLYDITVTHHSKNNRLMDHANILIASKSIQDELVRKGLILNDSPKEVRNLLFARPRNSGRDAIEITVKEVVDD